MTEAVAVTTQQQPALGGLTSAEAQSRAARGLANVDTTRQRTDADVVRSNVVSFFNVVLFSLIAALFAVGEFRDGFFVGIVVAANVAVATFQEIRALRTLRKLVALTAPHATVIRDGAAVSVLASEVVQGDLLHLRPGDQVVADGHVVAETAEIDESLLTGESDSVRKAPGSELLAGSFCTAGECYYTAERVGLEAYAVKLTADARSIVRRETPLQARFNRILRVLLAATAALGALLMISYNVEDRGLAESIKATTATLTTVVPAGLLLGMTVAFAVGAVRVSRANAVVQDIQAVEALNYVDVVCLDKTGTITANRLTLAGVQWAAQANEAADGPWLGAFAAASARESKTAAAMAERLAALSNGAQPDGSVPFSSERRWSAVRLGIGTARRTFVLGAPETVLPLCEGGGDLQEAYAAASNGGLRGVVFAEARELPEADRPTSGLKPLALLTLADVLRREVRGAFETMAALGIEPKLISGDNPHTVAALLAQLGIETKGGTMSGAELEQLDDEQFARAVEETTVFGRIAPALKARIVRQLKANKHYVAMVGDGANDVQALRAADVAVAMASGTATSRAVAGIILVNDSFEAFIRATKEAQAVLGNSARLAKLFIAKSFYAYLLIVATNMLGLNFPFLPRHGSLTALLTLGIPAVFIAIGVPPPDAGKDFTRSVLRFAIPASLALAASAIVVHLLSEGILGYDVEHARTLVSLVLGFTGVFYMVEVLGFEGASWRSLTRPLLTTFLGSVLIGGFFAVVYVPWLRDFFDFAEMGAGDWAVTGVAVAAALAGQFALSRYWQEVLDIVTAARSGQGIIDRGRPV